jgi:hypothetical protein
MPNPSLVNRKTELPEPDFISQANDQIRKNGTIDIASPIYQNAINQYNANIINGSIERLDVPEGYCGFIDPDSGEFRVEPEPLESDLRSSTVCPDNIVDPADVPRSVLTPYPIDCQLQVGLPGSYEYTQTVEGCAGKEDGDNICSDIAWFSGADTEEGSEEAIGGGTEALSQSVCGGGPGINSNTGLATSSPIGGVSSGDYPQDAWDVATAAAKELYPSAGFNMWSVSNKVGIILTYDFFYNVNDPDGAEGPEAFKEAGLRVSVSWNTETEMVAGEPIVTKMWEFEACTGPDCP